MAKTFLHVGCGRMRKNQTNRVFNSAEWDEVRLDIDPNVQPDIVNSITSMSDVADGSMDAIYSNHNIEHLLAHEVSLALNEFARVLKPNGFAVINCPDLQSVCAQVAEGRLIDTLYVSSAGPIAALDILYGFRPALANGQYYMAHRCGFTDKMLDDALKEAGFFTTLVQRNVPGFALHAFASKNPRSTVEMQEMATQHLMRA